MDYTELMIKRWYIKRALLLLLIMAAVTLIVMAVGQLNTTGRQIYYWLQLPDHAPRIAALDIERNVSVYFDPQPSLPLAGTVLWSLSPDGQNFVLKNGYNLMLMDIHGRNQRWLTEGLTNNYSPVWSPDGTRIVFVSERDTNSEIYVMDSDGSNQQRLTFNEIFDAYPSWSPSGHQILFASFQDGDAEIHVIDSDGKNQHSLTANDVNDLDPTWSSDGKHIIFTSGAAHEYAQRLFVMDDNGSNAHLLPGTSDNNSSPRWSADGKLILFWKDVYGIGGAYISKSDGSDLRLLTTAEHPVASPLWFIPPL